MSKNRKVALCGYIIIILFTILPIISVAIAQGLGYCLGCSVDEAGGSECIRWGINFGEVLTVMFVMGWMFFITIPIGFLLLIFWTVYVFKK